MGKKVNLKKELGLDGVQSLVNQLQAQAGEGEIDASLIDQIASAVNVAVDQAGNVNETVDDAVASSGAEPKPAAAPKFAPTDEAGVEDEDLEKSAPAASRTAAPAVFVSDDDEIAAKIPEFIKALESGKLKKAQQLMNNDQADFDRAFSAACRHVLDDAGITYKNMRKLHSSAPDIDPTDNSQLRKSLTASSGFTGVYLHRLAKLMMPVYAGLRRRIPASTPGVGSDQAIWRVQQGFQSLSFANLMSVGEAAIGEEISESATEFTVPFIDLSLNDRVSLKATAAARGYDDPMQIAIIRVMAAMLQAEERNLIGSNRAAIAAPAKPSTLTAAGTGTVGSATAKFYVTALTYRGWLAGSTGGTGAVGETEASVVSDAIDLSAKASVTIGWDAVPGAVAYNVYYNASSTTKWYCSTVLRNSVTYTALPASGNAPPAATTAANANGFEGLISWAELSTIYSNSIYNKVSPDSLDNAAMTATASGIAELDALLESLWGTWQIAPSILVTSPSVVGKITNLLMGLNSGGTYRIEVSQERGTMRGGAFVSGYVNKYAPFADGTPRYIDIIPHPYMPAGKALLLSETIPYSMSREARGFGIETLIPYTYFPLAASTISYPFAVTCSEVLECYHPAAQTAMTNIAA